MHVLHALSRKGSAPQDKPFTSKVPSDDDLVVVQSGEPTLVPKTPDSGPGLASPSHVGCRSGSGPVEISWSLIIHHARTVIANRHEHLQALMWRTGLFPKRKEKKKTSTSKSRQSARHVS